MPPAEEEKFWAQVQSVVLNGERAYLGTVFRGEPKVRVVFPALEGRTIWIATKTGSAKARQISIDPRVELFWETGKTRPAPHLAATGKAHLTDDPSAKRRLWNSGLFKYRLDEFWPSGPDSPDLVLIRIDVSRVELGWQPMMWSGEKALVWRTLPRDVGPRIAPRRRTESDA